MIHSLSQIYGRLLYENTATLEIPDFVIKSGKYKQVQRTPDLEAVILEAGGFSFCRFRMVGDGCSLKAV